MFVRFGLSIAIVLPVLLVAVSAFLEDIRTDQFVTGAVGVKILGAQSGGNIGIPVSGCGDVNGDSFHDFVGCATFINSNEGICYVIMGQGAAYVTDIDLADFEAGEGGFRVLGHNSNDHLGDNVRGVGDINADGFDDMLFAAPYFPSNQLTGRAYVVFGHAGAFIDLVLSSGLDASLGFHITGATTMSGLGLGADGGDFNGDGTSDLVVCASMSGLSGRSQAGACVVVMGHPGTPSTFSSFTMGQAYMSPSSDGFMIYGATAADGLGTRASLKCDFNGDDRDDLLLVAAYANNVYGVAYVLFGRPTGSGFSAIDLNGFTSSTTTGFRVFGPPLAWGGFGDSISSAGDFNADGIDDMLVTATHSTYDGVTEAGTLFVIFGSASRGADIDLASFSSGAVGFMVGGDQSYSMLGFSASCAGDMNGDGIDDIVVGAHGEDSYSQTNNGYAIVLFGHTTATSFPDINIGSFTSSPTTGFRIYGKESGDTLGTAVAGVGDVNGDGVDDLLIGSQNEHINGVANMGAMYLIYGHEMPHPPTAQPTVLPTADPTAVPSLPPSAVPTLQPSEAPTLQPSAEPTLQPSEAPTLPPSASPTLLPSAAPTFDPALQTLLTSLTHMVKNGFAFAALDSTGHVHTWGEMQHGGMSAPVQGLLQDVTSLIPSRFSFGALTADGTFLTWGVNMMFLASGAHSAVVANEAAYAAIRVSDGGVTVTGSKHNGGNVEKSGFSTQLSSGVQSITASAGAFAALKTDGTVYTWGNRHSGAGVSSDTMPELAGVNKVVATREAFAALLSSGRVYTWGGRYGGGDSSAVSSQLMSGVVDVIAAKQVFVAMKTNLHIVAWGLSAWGGDTSAVASALAGGVLYVAHTFIALSAILRDGTVVAWGDAAGGGDCSAVQSELHNVVYIYGNSKAFAALRGDGSVVTWGKAAYGGQIPSNKVTALSSGVVSIYHTDRAFAALKTTGAVVVWGQAGHGGSPGAVVEAHLVSGVHTICTNDVAFSVIKTDGSVVGWGHPVSIATAGVLFNSADLQANVTCA